MDALVDKSGSTTNLTNRRLIIFGHALFFVIGFSIVFIIGWGGAATFVGELFGAYKPIIGKVGGVVVILFGLSTIGILKIPWINYDTRPQWDGTHKSGYLASSLMGVFFAAGWTPCIGTTLGAILTLSVTQQSSSQGLLLSSGYALGLAVPFLLVGLFVDRALTSLKRMRKFVRPLQIASGVLMILVGVLILTNQMTLIAIWAQRNGFFLDLKLGGAATPTYLIAVLAGLLSFFSPCVLPLVPAYMGYLSGHAFGSPKSGQVT